MPFLNTALSKLGVTSIRQRFPLFLTETDTVRIDKWLVANKQGCSMSISSGLAAPLSTWCSHQRSPASASHAPRLPRPLPPLSLMAGLTRMLMIMNSVITKHRYEMQGGAAQPQAYHYHLCSHYPGLIRLPNSHQLSLLMWQFAWSDPRITLAYGWDEVPRSATHRSALAQARTAVLRSHLLLALQGPVNGHPEVALVGTA